MTPMQDGAAHWLAVGECGVSSETMCLWLAFGKKKRDFSHPHDPDDLDRCLQLLAMVPQMRAELPRMAELSLAWSALVERWDEIERSHLDEVGLGWHKARSAPKTYRLMRDVIDNA